MMNATMDTRVGFGATSILEQEVRAYIIAHTENGTYTGAVEYLQKYAALHAYNATEED